VASEAMSFAACSTVFMVADKETVVAELWLIQMRFTLQ